MADRTAVTPEHQCKLPAFSNTERGVVPLPDFKCPECGQMWRHHWDDQGDAGEWWTKMCDPAPPL